ncbi:TPA: hypothetical protein I9000_001511 [Clostridium perfringens]|nr:Uncharacterised protein [Clostridium perfringens]HAT4188572.1 hypothetical protein [Clostridium perfringens]HAT4194007.1 hypothetical protein [Clostridium perfringens]
MRNVNTTILVVILFALERFILTMRNVNYEMMKIVILSGEFYINYEECKSNIFIGLSWISISFILTMRNVN